MLLMAFQQVIIALSDEGHFLKHQHTTRQLTAKGGHHDDNIPKQRYSQVMDFESIRKACLSFPGATEDIQWEKDLLFRVGGKMFAVVGLEPEPDNVAFKCTPEEFAELTLRNGIIPAPYLARHHWVSVTDLEALRKAELERLLQISYQLVLEGLPKKIRKSIGETGKKSSTKKKSTAVSKKARGK